MGNVLIEIYYRGASKLETKKARNFVDAEAILKGIHTNFILITVEANGMKYDHKTSSNIEAIKHLKEIEKFVQEDYQYNTTNHAS